MAFVDTVDVCLVEMPFSSYATPSYSLSILQACLQHENIAARVLYGNMRFAKLCGSEDYEAVLSKVNQGALLGEAIFSSCLNLPRTYSFQEYLHSFKQYSPLADDSYIEEMRCTSNRVHSLAEPFLEDLAEEILALNPKIVAMASVFFQHNACLALARVLKAKKPDLVTIIGGANCTGEAGVAIVKYIPWIDYTFSGEADECFGELCRLMVERGLAAADESLPYGTISKAMALGLLAKNEYPVRVTADLDSIPAPDYHDYFRELELFSLKNTVIPALFYEFSRGCWWHAKKPCTFCGLNGTGKNYRIKSNAKIISDLLHLNTTYHNNRISLTDNIISYEHLRTLLPELIALPEKFIFFAEVKSNLTRQNLHDLRQAGFIIIQPGIESLHDGALKLMNKGNRAIKHIELLRNAEEEGIYAIWHLLSGFPLEEEMWYQEMAEVIPKITHLRPPKLCLHILYSKYSEYYRNSAKYNIELRPAKGYHYVYPALGDYIVRTAYMFEPTDEKQLSTYLLMNFISEKHAKLADIAQKWQKTFAANKDILTMTRCEDSIELVDLRNIAKQSFYSLTGVQKRIYELCRDVISRKHLNTLLTAEFEQAAIEAAIDYLLEQSLLIAIGGELLALAMEQKDHVQPTPTDYPVGRFCSQKEIIA